jgi:hypothetical protein
MQPALFCMDRDFGSGMGDHWLFNLVRRLNGDAGAGNVCGLRYSER